VLALRSAAGLTALALSATLLSACAAAPVSNSNLTGDSKAVAQTISSLQSDAQSRNNSQLCDRVLSRTVVNRLAAGANTCSSVISKQLGEADDYTLTLSGANPVVVTGDKATARVTDTYSGHKNHVDVLHLVREGSTWKVDCLGPGPCVGSGQ
jgi:hypothetical protein